MVDRVVLTYADIDDAVAHLVKRWHKSNPIERPTNVVPVPRGGNIPAAMVAERIGMPLSTSVTMTSFVVDDLVDSGETAKRYAPCGRFDALYRKERSPRSIAPGAVEVPDDVWLVFPWEVDTADEAGPADAVTRLLEFIGEDPTRPGLLDTPRRVLSSFGEMTAGYVEDPATHLGVVFPDACDEMVVVTDIEFTSLCEHHLLPFVGTAAIAYIPDGQVVGLSKLARVVDVFARRLQVQERLTNQIAEAIDEHLSPKGVGVVLRARHACMGCRGVRKPGASMTTSALRGAIKDKPAARSEFMTLAHSHP